MQQSKKSTVKVLCAVGREGWPHVDLEIPIDSDERVVCETHAASTKKSSRKKE